MGSSPEVEAWKWSSNTSIPRGPSPMMFMFASNFKTGSETRITMYNQHSQLHRFQPHNKKKNTFLWLLLIMFKDSEEWQLFMVQRWHVISSVLRFIAQTTAGFAWYFPVLLLSSLLQTTSHMVSSLLCVTIASYIFNPSHQATMTRFVQHQDFKCHFK